MSWALRSHAVCDSLRLCKTSCVTVLFCCFVYDVEALGLRQRRHRDDRVPEEAGSREPGPMALVRASEFVRTLAEGAASRSRDAMEDGRKETQSNSTRCLHGSRTSIRTCRPGDVSVGKIWLRSIKISFLYGKFSSTDWDSCTAEH